MNCVAFMVDCREDSANPPRTRSSPMSLENGHDNKDKRHPEELRNKPDVGEGADKVAAAAGGHTPTSQDVDDEETVSHEAEAPAQLDKSYYAEASLTKKITVFALTTVLILITLGLIYAYLPHGTPR